MTRWLQDRPRELSRLLRKAVQSDLRDLALSDEARALMSGAADMIDREILNDPRLPLHWSLRDRMSDAWHCLRGRAVVLRSWPEPLGYRFERLQGESK